MRNHSARTCAFAAMLLIGSALADNSLPVSLGDTETRDASVTALVRSKLDTNTNTRNLHIEVDTKDGVVRLRGKVRSAEERDLAELLARNTEMVRLVQNDLVVLRR